MIMKALALKYLDARFAKGSVIAGALVFFILKTYPYFIKYNRAHFCVTKTR